MRVLMTCHTGFDLDSGACGCTVNIGKNLQTFGISVDYYTHSDLPESLGVRLKHCLFAFFVYGHVQRFKKWDVVDATTADTWILGKMRGKEKKPKIVVSSHGLEHIFEEKRVIYEKKTSWRYRSWAYLNLKLVESTLRSADHIVVLTQNEKEYIKTNFSIPQERISVVYHSLPEYFKNLPEYRLPDEFKILFVGNWIQRKGGRYLLEALENLCSDNIDFSVTLAGLRATKESSLKREMSDRLWERVRFIRFLENSALPQLYLSHSVFVFPSFYEGFGMVLTEAMAAGIPIITTRAGIAEEWIRDKVNGIIVPYGDSQAIYKALVWAFKHPDEMRNCGRNAKDLIHKVDQGQEAKQRMDIYERLINCNSSSV